MFDTMIIGQICMDTNTDFDGRTEHRYGGAVLFSGHAAAAMTTGQVAVVLKCIPGGEIDPAEAFADCPNVHVFTRPSQTNTIMENVYFTADRERRRSRCLSVIDGYTPSDIPAEETRVYHLAGLTADDISGEIIQFCARRADVALDVQCMMRRVQEDRTLKLFDWEEKKDYLPYIRYLKTDAAEAEALTGTADREEAARMLYAWGAKEVMITHNTEVLVYDGVAMYRAPLRPRNLSGRTGRGDTTFAGYLVARQHMDISEALNLAAALVSLKMETPGPFTGSREDVSQFMKETGYWE